MSTYKYIPTLEDFLKSLDKKYFEENKPATSKENKPPKITVWEKLKYTLFSICIAIAMIKGLWHIGIIMDKLAS